MAEHKIALTSCPLSNAFVADSMKGDLVRRLLERGVKVTINSDDPAYFGGYIAENFYQLAKTYQFSKADLVQLARNSFEGAWCLEEKKAEYLREVDEFVEAFSNEAGA